MAGLMYDPTKDKNTVAGAIQAMSGTMFGPQTLAAPRPGPVVETSGFLPQSKQLPVPDQVSPLPLPRGTKPLPVPDQVSPLPLPNPTPGPAPVPAPFVEDNRTIEQRLNGLLSADSDYIKRARAEGMAVANRRGLANSSIAAGAAQGAAIDRALPIAQGDTDIAAQDRRLRVSVDAERARLEQAAGYDMERLKTSAGFDIVRDAAQAKNAQELAGVQGQITSRLQAQGNSEQIQRMGLELVNQLQLQSAQLMNDLNKIAASGDQDIRRLVEAANQERVTLEQSIAAQDRERMASAMVNIFQIEAQMRAALLGNTTIPASERAAYERSISALGDPAREYIAKLFGGEALPAVPGATPVIPPIIPPGGGGTGGVPGGGVDGVATDLGLGGLGGALSDPYANVPINVGNGLVNGMTPEERARLGLQ